MNKKLEDSINEIVAKMNELTGKDIPAELVKKGDDLKRQLDKIENRIDDEETFAEKELREKFYKVYGQITAGREAAINDVKAKKEEIVAQAKKLKDSKEFKKTSEDFKKLLDSWKSAGRSSKEVDDALWAEFKESMDTFYAAKKEYFAQASATLEENKNKKLDIIARAKEANKKGFKEAEKDLNNLLEEWKKTGFAGKKDNDSLWDQFREERKVLNAKKDEYYKELKKSFQEKADQKRELIEQAKKYVFNPEYTFEESNAVKELRKKWKEIGFCGKEDEDKLWDQFNSLINNYFDNKKQN